MDKGLVSIILPVYNGERFIGQAIESIINQTYDNWELIIVNDCSNDNSLDICEQYSESDPRIMVVSNVKNLKLPASLNVGFSKAKGKYLTWTSDDNLYKNTAIETMVSYLSSNPNVDMVYSNYTSINTEGEILNHECMLNPENIVFGNVFGACFLYTSDIANKVGTYDTNLFLAEDYDYWIRIYSSGVIHKLDEDLYFYRIHNNSLTVSKKNMIDIQTYKALEKNFLPLYSKTSNFRFRYMLFDQMLKRNNTVETLKKIYTIDPKFKYVRIIREVKRKFIQ